MMVRNSNQVSRERKQGFCLPQSCTHRLARLVDLLAQSASQTQTEVEVLMQMSRDLHYLGEEMASLPAGENKSSRPPVERRGARLKPPHHAGSPCGVTWKHRRAERAPGFFMVTPESYTNSIRRHGIVHRLHAC